MLALVTSTIDLQPTSRRESTPAVGLDGTCDVLCYGSTAHTLAYDIWISFSESMVEMVQ
jgi:hypothetical protein